MRRGWGSVRNGLSLALVGAWLLGCGSDGGSGLVCGDGTVEQNGQCVLPPAGDVVEPDAASPCGAGTVLVDGQCVIDDEAVADLLKPEVASVKVTQLAIDEEGVRSVYPLHPLNASVTLDVDTTEALDTAVVLGLENGDGSKRCIVGYWPLVSGTPVVAEGGATVQTLTLAKEFYVQPSCDVLVGETGVVAWVAFDPFDRVNVAGRTLTANEEDDLITFILQSRLPLDECTAPESPHAANCTTALAVEASPGRDVVMQDLTLSSSVAVLEVPEPVTQPEGGTIPDAEGDINVEDAGPSLPLSTAPHFLINADLLVFGLDGSEDDQVEDAALSLSFAIRPVIDPLDANDWQPEEIDWQPLYSELQEPPKAGEEPVITLLEEEFLKSMVGAQSMVRTSPIFITGDTEGRIGSGIWSKFDQFELRVCAGADFDEAGVAEDAAANNCQIRPVYVLRRNVRYNVAADEEEAAAVPGHYRDGYFYDNTWGNTNKVAVRLNLGGDVWSRPDSASAGAILGAYLMGWFDLTLLEVSRYGYDYYDTARQDSIITRLIVFNITIVNTTANFPVGTTAADVAEFSRSSPELTAGFDLGVVTIGVAASAVGAIGLRTSLTREVTASAGNNPKCAVAGAVTVGNRCVKVFATAKTQAQANEACRRDNGWLSTPNSQAMLNAIVQSRNAGGVADRYIWVDGISGLGSCYERFVADRQHCYDEYILDRREQECIDGAEVTLANCRNIATIARHLWTWMDSPEPGTLQMYPDVLWNAGEPNDSPPGESRLTVRYTANLNDAHPNSMMAYSCTYPTTLPAGGRVTGVIEPYASLTLHGAATIDITVAGAELWIDLILIEVALPISSTIQWFASTPITTLATGQIELVLTGLGGAIGATVWARVIGSWTVTIFSWDSIEYGRWTLGRLLPRWRVQ